MQKSYSTIKKPTRALRVLSAMPGAAAGVLLMSLISAPVYAEGKSGDPAIASKELARRQEAAEKAQQLIAEADAIVDQGGSDCEAADKYRSAAIMLRPGAPATEAIRSEAVRKFCVTGVACAQVLARNGQYTDANARLDQILAEDMAPKCKPAQTLQRNLKDPDRYNPAMTPQHAGDVEKVKRLFIIAQGRVDIGDYDAARAAYNQILAIDATNTAARRGLENVEKLNEEYLKSARDHTRIKALNEVDRQWESKVPSLAGIRPAGASGNAGDLISGSTSLSAKLRTIVIPRLSMTDASITEAISYLSKKSRELDPEPDESKRGVNIIWRGAEGDQTRPITLELANISLAEAIRAVCDVSGTRFQTSGAVVTISMRGGSALETRQFRVPPGFLATSASASPTESEAADPFGSSDAAAKPKLGRLDPKTFLEKQGIPFPEGTRAGYSPSQNLLTVTNSPESLDAIAAYVEGLTTSSQRQVLIKVVLLKASEQRLEELGGEFFLAPFKAGGGMFAAGGTGGNSEIGGTVAASAGALGAQSFQAIDVPFNVVQGPVTAGLRSSYELTRTQNIDDLINISNNGLTSSTQNRSPYIVGVGGVFTNPAFQALVRGLDQQKGVDLSVANSVIVKSGQRATSFTGRDFFYPTEFDPPQIPQTVVAPRLIFQDPTTGQLFQLTLPLGQPPVTPATPNSFEKKEIGSAMEVEAVIGEDGYTVDLNLAVNFSEFDGFINYGAPITTPDSNVVLTDNRIIQPVFSKVAANANVLIYDGQTVAIGGLSQSKTETVQDKVPVWSSIPVFGRFFKSNLQRHTRTAIVYFVTVNIVDPAGEHANNSDTIDSGKDTAPTDSGVMSIQ